MIHYGDISEIAEGENCSKLFGGFWDLYDGFKVKIKYNDYVYMHRMLNAVSSVNLVIKSIAEDRFDDMVAKVPAAYRDRVLAVAKAVWDYKHRTEKSVEEAYALAPKESKKDFMSWVDKNVPHNIQGYVRCKYLNKDFNVLKKGEAYRKIKEMGVSVDAAGKIIEN